MGCRLFCAKALSCIYLLLVYRLLSSWQVTQLGQWVIIVDFNICQERVCAHFTSSHLYLLRVRGRVRLGSPRAWLLLLPLLLLLLPLGPQIPPWTPTYMSTNGQHIIEQGLTLFDSKFTLGTARAAES